jgi:MOSC domain-containing protein YiiM
MELISVNVGQPRPVSYRGRDYATSIYKTPLSGRVRVRHLNIDGDAQGNLKTHGGPDMAVYAFGHEHYAHWVRDLGRNDLGFGAFGENLTVTGMMEKDIAIGDVFAIGDVRLQVTEPRTPCHKLAMKFEDDDLPRRFAATGHVGFYFRVLQAGDIGAGDVIALVSKDPAALTIAEVLGLWADLGAKPDRLARALAVPALSATWRGRFARRLAASTKAQGALEWSPQNLTWIEHRDT